MRADAVAVARGKPADFAILSKGPTAVVPTTIADPMLYCCADFCASEGFKLDLAPNNFHNWLESINGRPSAST